MIYADTLQTDTRKPFPAVPRSQNRLLAALPSEDYERIAPYLKRVPMRLREVIYKQDVEIDELYFPGGGACTLVKTTRDGHSAEIAVVGCEGAIGGPLLFGHSVSPCDVIVQVAGPYADVLPLEVFKRETERRGVLHDRTAAYSHVLLLQLMQAVACNGLHSAEKRVARWLLTTHDHADRDEFRFTHEFVATMLGLRRPTVTLVVKKLQQARLIECRRGAVKIQDRSALEAASCECYHVIKARVSASTGSRHP